MKNNSKHTTAPRPGTLCTAPALGAQVPDYIVERLNDQQAEVIENHLLECKDCRETYMTIICTREAGRRKRLATDQDIRDVLPKAEALTGITEG